MPFANCRSFLFTVLVVLVCRAANGQAPADADLNRAFPKITENSVTATISFLASDEMAGRGTPSKEFNIAAAYVAARFRGAGLKGGGKDGGFYQETVTRQTQTPTGGIVFQDSSGRDLEQVGLFASSAEINYSGPLAVVDLAQEFSANSLTGVVAGKLSTEARGPRAASQVARLANSLRAAGAEALVLYVDRQSELVKIANSGRERARAENPRNRMNLPVLLAVGEPVNADLIQLKLPKQIVQELPMRNVIGVLPGADPELAKQAVVFSAHLDHLGVREGTGDGIFNGADDDASGVTAVLTLADAFAALSQPPQRTVIFMTFWGEESGLLGSRQFAEDPTWPLEQIVANINIEMIGRPEPGANEKIWMTGWDQSDLGQIMNAESAAIGIEIFEHPRFSAMLYRASDNWSLAEKGVVAHSFSAGSLHSDYHQPDDEWDRLNIPHMTRVIQGLFAGSQGLCRGSVMPKKSK